MPDATATEQITKEALKKAEPRIGAKKGSESAVLARINSRRALERARERTPWGVQEDVLTRAAENIHIDTPADPLHPTVEEQARINEQTNRKNDYEDRLDALSTCITQGAEGLEASHPEALEYYREVSLGTLQSYPFLREMFASMDDAAKEDFQKRFLSDPEFQVHLNTVTQELVQFDVDVELTERRAFRKAELTAGGMAEGPAQAQADTEITQDKLEQEWKDRVDSSIETAAVNFVNKNLDGIDQELKENSKKIDAELNVKASKEGKATVGNVAEILRTRWNDKDKDKDNVNADWDNVLKAGGPSALLAELKNSGVINDDQLETILNDEKLLKDFEAYTVKTLIAKRSRRGGKFSKLDIENLVDAQWCGQEKFMEIMTTSGQFEQFMKQLEDQGKVSRGFWHEVARLPKNKFAMILMALMGVVLSGGVASAAFAGMGLAGAGVASAGATGVFGTGIGVAAYEDRHTG